MSYFSHCLHESEVGSHGITKAGHLAEFWDQKKLVASFLMNRNYHRLIAIFNFLTIFLLIIFFIGNLFWLNALLTSVFGETIKWRRFKINLIHLVGPLVITGQYGCTDQIFLNLFTRVIPASLFDVRDEVKNGISSKDLVYNVDIE